ncbi:MAG: LuxR C-terminal-related transcriptional regulator [Pseudomonadota bacterium]
MPPEKSSPDSSMPGDIVAEAVGRFETSKSAPEIASVFMKAVMPHCGIGFTAAEFDVNERSRLLLYTSMPEVFTPLDRDSAWWADDPVVAELGMGTLLPFNVEDAWSRPLASAAPRWEALTEIGLHRGWVFPTSKPGFIGGVHLIADPDNYLPMARDLGLLHLLAKYMHAFMTELDPDEDGGVVVRNTLRLPATVGKSRKLSPREVTCLRWCAFGKTAEEIALIEGLSPHTVRDYLREAQRKLDSRSQAQAVARALKYGVFRI